MIKNKSKFRTIHILLFLVVVGYIFIANTIQKKQLYNLEKKSLQSLVDEKSKLVDMFLKSQKDKLLTISSMDIFVSVVKNPANIASVNLAKNLIQQYKNNISNITILSRDGIVIVGDISLPGTNYSQQPYFGLVNKKIVFESYYDPIRLQDYYAIVGPINDPKDKNKIIGAIAFDVPLDDISKLLKQDLSGANSEVYLIDNNGMLLSRSAYLDRDPRGGILMQKVKSEGAKDCLNDLAKYTKDGVIEKHEEILARYVNYMGNDVYGAHAYTTEILGCVIGEVNKEGLSSNLKYDDIKLMFKSQEDDEEK